MELFNERTCYTVDSRCEFAIKLLLTVLFLSNFQQGRNQKFFFVEGGIKVFFWGGGIKLFNSRSDVILPDKKFTWVDFLGGYKYPYTSVSGREAAAPPPLSGCLSHMSLSDTDI